MSVVMGEVLRLQMGFMEHFASDNLARKLAICPRSSQNLDSPQLVTGTVARTRRVDGTADAPSDALWTLLMCAGGLGPRPLGSADTSTDGSATASAVVPMSHRIAATLVVSGRLATKNKNQISRSHKVSCLLYLHVCFKTLSDFGTPSPNSRQISTICRSCPCRCHRSGRTSSAHRPAPRLGNGGDEGVRAVGPGSESGPKARSHLL